MSDHDNSFEYKTPATVEQSKPTPPSPTAPTIKQSPPTPKSDAKPTPRVDAKK
jgi:hypothetical protein